MPAATSVRYYIFHDKENKYMIEIDAFSIIVALITAAIFLGNNYCVDCEMAQNV